MTSHDPIRRRSRLSAVLTRSLLSLCTAAVIWVLTAAPAAAHDALISSDPADGATVARPPLSVVLTFDEPAVAVGTAVVVTDAAGRQVQAGPPQLIDATVTQPLQPGVPAGTYVVMWRVTSTDGHPVTGSTTFTAQQAAPGQLPSPQAAPRASPSPAPSSDPSGRLPAGLKVVIGLAAIAFGVTVARRAGGRGHPQGRV